MPRFLAAVALFFMVPGQAGAAHTFEGLWLTENGRSVIHVERCEQGLCGYVHWIIEGGMQYDLKNPDENLQTDPICGLRIMWGFKEESPTLWDGGRIYKADDGDTYDASVEMLDNGQLNVRGYMGLSMLGKSQTWTRVSEKDHPQCKKPD